MDFPVPLVLPDNLTFMEPVHNDTHHIIPYRTLLTVLAGLITLTLISVFITQIALGTLTVAIALLIAAVKSSFVLRIFMHLKFENRFISSMVVAVILIIAAVIFITLLDYIYR
jgi:cytochrome c oxidase subunit IV